MAIGDIAHFAYPDPLPGVAQVALQMGKHVARNLRDDGRGRPRKPFRYRNLGNMATVGRKLAVAEIGEFRFAGYLAWADMALRPPDCTGRFPQSVRGPHSVDLELRH